MKISFEKYQGTGNDFVMINNWENRFSTSELPIDRLCDRKFGIGADGLIVIEKHPSLDFNMIYFNSDGSQSFCGNGSRCAVAFAKKLGIIGNKTTFLSTDGEHYAETTDSEVKLKMHDVLENEFSNSDYIINTGSPHYIQFVDSVNGMSVVEKAKFIRYNDRFNDEGINVNFIEDVTDGIKIRTYERGVEDETLSCGTGVTAAALANSLKLALANGSYSTNVQTEGGKLKVSFTKNESQFYDIYLIGPAEYVFSGVIEI